MSTFSGIISEIPNVSVDQFEGPNLKSTAYFLSHCHSDHMKGLLALNFLNRLQKTGLRLYCSEISFEILMSMDRGIEQCRDSIHVLSYNMESIISVPPSDNHPEAQDITVTVIPAGHCPGSVMFMFEYELGRILYTGDIRIVEGDIRKLRQLLDNEGKAKPILNLYLDTTFLSPLYNYFPPRKASALVLCQLIGEWIDANPEHYVEIDTPAKHGYEYLFVEICNKLKTKVHVPQDHYELYRRVPEVQHAITASAALTQVHACARYQKGGGKIPCALLGECWRKGLVRKIKTSAMWFRDREYEDGEIFFGDDKNKYKVAYSCHSSFDELKDIIMFLNPKVITPCVVPPDLKTEDETMERLRDTRLTLMFPETNCSNKENDMSSPPRRRVRIF